MKLISFLAIAFCSSVIAAKPMNVVVLYGDDWRHDTLGVAGHPVVKTPRLDRLAAESVRFTHNCVTTSICGVSRASLHTGQWMSRHGCRGFTAWTTPWDLSLPALLRAKGYHTGHVGKWHNGKDPVGKFDFGRFYNGRHWYPTEDGGKIHSTARNEKDALEFLRTRPQDKPFYLNVAFFTPHARIEGSRLMQGSVIHSPACGLVEPCGGSMDNALSGCSRLVEANTETGRDSHRKL